jgi:hypothetical protein
MARAGERLDRELDRDPGEPVTIDLDATQVTVYGQRKQGAARSRHGSMSYAPHAGNSNGDIPMLEGGVPGAGETWWA